MTTFNIEFEPLGRRGTCLEGESIMDCARRLHIGLASTCGGVGTCGKCRLKVMSGNVSGLTASEREELSAEEIAAGWRLACQVYPGGDIKLHVPAESMTTPQRMQVEGMEQHGSFDPPVKAYQVKLSTPTLSDQHADAERLIAALNQQHNLNCSGLDYSLIKTMSPQLRTWNWQLRAAVRGQEVVAVAPIGGRQLGFAADLGSTKIAGYIVDMADGKTLAAKGAMNPQISYGEDIISRITVATSSPEKAREIQRLVTDALDQLAADLCAEVGARPYEIVEAVVVANTAMHHLFLGLPVKQLAMNPFVPAISNSVDIKARELGMHFAPGAYVHVLPNVAMFVGADHVSMLLATEAWKEAGPVVAIDIGTNTEVSLVYNGKITAASCASGPALEGGYIKDGMRAASGAIERVKISRDKVEYQTIDDAPPVGICGSGILDTLAQMHLAGVVDDSGRMKENHVRVRNGEKGREFVLVEAGEHDGNPAIVFTQHDVRQLQLGKAAIRAGIQMLLETNDCPESEIKQVVIAGAFGSYIDVGSAVTVGMMPALPLDRFKQVGNAAGMGAKQALVSLSLRDTARSVARIINHIELSSQPYFNQTFTQAMYLGKYRMKQGKREELS